MREYKKLQKLADNSLKQYDNREFLEEMKSKIREKNAKPQKTAVKRRKIFYTSFAAALSVVAVIFSVFLIFPNKNVANEEKHYTIDHKETEIVDLNVLNNGLIEIYFDNRDYKEIKKYYDTFYNETLYYETNLIISEFDRILIYIVTNKDYEYTVDYSCDKEDMVYGYNLSYSEEFSDMGGVYECKVYGYMDTGAEKVYFTYNTYTLEQSSNFVNLVKDLIKKK